MVWCIFMMNVLLKSSNSRSICSSRLRFFSAAVLKSVESQRKKFPEPAENLLPKTQREVLVYHVQNFFAPVILAYGPVDVSGPLQKPLNFDIVLSRKRPDELLGRMINGLDVGPDLFFATEIGRA